MDAWCSCNSKSSRQEQKQYTEIQKKAVLPFLFKNGKEMSVVENGQMVVGVGKGVK